jgi:dipeptidyl aminopeptidase/acylaminoacyl peptidase
MIRRHRVPAAPLALALALAALTALPAPEAAAQPADDRGPAADSLLTVDRFLDWEGVGGPRISPDGRRILYERRHVDRMEDDWDSGIWIMDADGSRNRFLVEGSSPRWSPDGTRIAYLAEGDPEGSQVFVLWLGTGDEPTQVTRVTESPGNVQWSPDGTRLSFLMDVPAERGWSVEVPAAPEGAEWTAPPRVVHRLHYRADGRGFTDDAYTHLFTVPADGGTPRQLTEGDWNVGARFDALPFGGGYDWTPDGRRIVFDGWREGDPDMNYRNSHLYVVNVESRDIRRLTREAGTWTSPVVSPDGRQVAYTGYPETELTYTTPDLWTRPLDGDGGRRKLSGDLERPPADLHWAPDGSGVYFTAADRGSENVHFAPAAGDGPRPVTEGPQVLDLSSVSDDGTAAAVREAAHEPGDVVAFDLDRPDRLRRLTRVNDDVLDGVRLGEVEEIWYRSGDGTRVQGWIVKPPDFDPAREYPFLLSIHGGPHAMYDVGFSFSFQNFAAHGYVVLYTNPRGSTGYGTDFAAAISQDYPGPDHGDLMAGVDSLVARGYVDPDRLFAAGCSGGGVLSSWAIGQTDRFAAAAVRCPVTDWISMAGTTDIPLFTHGWFDRPFWEDPSAWLEHSSLMHVDEVTTPTLLMTGELDLRTPMAQTEEYFAALRMLGVPTVMLRFQEEYHGTGSNPSNFMRTQKYMLDWFENEGEIEGLTAPGGSE